MLDMHWSLTYLSFSQNLQAVVFLYEKFLDSVKSLSLDSLAVQFMEHSDSAKEPPMPEFVTVTKIHSWYSVPKVAENLDIKISTKLCDILRDSPQIHTAFSFLIIYAQRQMSCSKVCAPNSLSHPVPAINVTKKGQPVAEQPLLVREVPRELHRGALG